MGLIVHNPVKHGGYPRNWFAGSCPTLLFPCVGSNHQRKLSSSYAWNALNILTKQIHSPLYSRLPPVLTKCLNFKCPVQMTPTKTSIRSFVVKSSSWSGVYSTRLRRPQSFQPTTYHCSALTSFCWNVNTISPWSLAWRFRPTCAILMHSWLRSPTTDAALSTTYRNEITM